MYHYTSNCRHAPSHVSLHLQLQVASYAQVTHGVMRHQSKHWIRTLCDKEPVVAFSLIMGGIARFL